MPSPHRPHGPLADPEKVITLLESTRSVTLTASILGVRVQRLSAWLRGAKRKAWWEHTKKQWSVESYRAKRRRMRERRAAREGRVYHPRQRKPKQVAVTGEVAGVGADGQPAQQVPEKYIPCPYCGK